MLKGNIIILAMAKSTRAENTGKTTTTSSTMPERQHTTKDDDDDAEHRFVAEQRRQRCAMSINLHIMCVLENMLEIKLGSTFARWAGWLTGK